MPSATTPTLRPFQADGARWLASRLRALLGDEPGLGKSPQSVAAASAIGARSALILAPAATLCGWTREVARWAGGRELRILDKPAALKSWAAEQAAGDYSWAVVAWSRAVAMAEALSELQRPASAAPLLDVLIIDECHYAKNPTAGRTPAALGRWRNAGGAWVRVRGLVDHAARVWCLSGTAVPNRPIEIQPILAAILPEERWVKRTAFGERFCRQSNRFTPSGFDYNGSRDLDALAELLRQSGAVLRRRKADVLKDLPSLDRQWYPVKGEGEALARVKRLEKAFDGASILSALGEGKVVGVSEGLSEYRKACGLAKAAAVAEIVADAVEAGDGSEGILVGVWHREVAEAIRAALEKHGVSALVADGSQTPEERQGQVDRFAKGEAPVLVASIAACGTGMNGMQSRCSRVYVAELPWVPAELEQLEGRVHRFGSALQGVAGASVQSILLGLPDSLDGRIAELLASKAEIAATVLDTQAATVSPGLAPILVEDVPQPVGRVALSLSSKVDAAKPVPPAVAKRGDLVVHNGSTYTVHWSGASKAGQPRLGLMATAEGPKATVLWIDVADVDKPAPQPVPARIAQKGSVVVNRGTLCKVIWRGPNKYGGGERLGLVPVDAPHGTNPVFVGVHECVPDVQSAEAARVRGALRDRAVNRQYSETCQSEEALTQEETARAQIARAALQRLAFCDPDKASKENGIGFSKSDGMVGHWLANLPLSEWRRGTLETAVSVLRVYSRTQVADLWPAIKGAA